MAISESTAERYTLADPDVRLMLQVRDGSAAAFEELVLRYQNRLLTVLEHLVNSREQAEDLAQEVFLRVFRARKRYEPAAKFSTWLFTIANNVASNARRSRAHRRVRRDQADPGRRRDAEPPGITRARGRPAGGHRSHRRPPGRCRVVLREGEADLYRTLTQRAKRFSATFSMPSVGRLPRRNAACPTTPRGGSTHSTHVKIDPAPRGSTRKTPPPRTTRPR